MMLTDDQLVETFTARFTHSAFRLEQLPAYEVPSDHLDEDPAKVSDYDRWLAGAAEPLWERKEPFLRALRAERQALKLRHRVRILGGPDGLHPYEEYEAAFGYVPNFKAGEDIHILDRVHRPIPPVVPSYDFWLLDDEAVIRMYYGPGGEYEGAELITDPHEVVRHMVARDAALAASEPFPTWWVRHAELHRATRKVAA